MGGLTRTGANARIKGGIGGGGERVRGEGTTHRNTNHQSKLQKLSSCHLISWTDCPLLQVRGLGKTVDRREHRVKQLLYYHSFTFTLHEPREGGGGGGEEEKMNGLIANREVVLEYTCNDAALLINALF